MMYHSWYVILIGTIRAFSKKYYVISISYRDFSSVTYTLCLFAFRHNNTKAQCGNYKIFLLLRFYVKLKLANVESLNLHSHTFRGYWRLKRSPKFISRKIWVTEKSLDLHIVNEFMKTYTSMKSVFKLGTGVLMA